MDIAKAAAEYASREWADGIESDVSKSSFIAGATYRINGIWHDATEIPPHNAHILVRFRHGSMSTWYVSDGIRNTFGKFDVIAWAYVEDIIPSKED